MDREEGFIERLAEANVAYLYPYVEKRLLAALTPDFVPRAPRHLDFATRHGFRHPDRCLMAFLAADTELDTLSDEMDKRIEKSGSLYVVNRGTPQERHYASPELVAYLGFYSSYRIMSAWLQQLNASAFAREVRDAPALSLAMLDDAMLPPERHSFHFVLTMGSFDIDASLDVLREAKAALPDGHVVPRFAAKVFFPSTIVHSLS